MRATAAITAALVSLTLACGDDGPAVPFGLDTPHPEATTAPPPTSAPTDPGAVEWPAGAEVRVDDTPLAIEGAEIRATLAGDLDADGDRDVVMIATSIDGALSVSVATRASEGVTFAPPVSIAGVCAPAILASARLVPLSSDLVAARIERTCNGAAEQRVVAIRTRPTARVLTTLVLAPTAGETMTVRAEDRDADTHVDVVMHLSLHEAGGESADVDLAWLDRAAGLSRDTAEPETFVAARAAEARTALRRHPDRALAATRTALLAHDAVCGATARLAIDDDVGIACPASVGLGRALATAAAAHARLGHLDDALAAVVALGRADATVRDADRTLARDALTAMTGVLHPATNEGPEAHVAGSADVPRLSSLAFLTDDRVLLRQGSPRVITLSSGASEPSSDGDTTLADPARAHCIAEVGRSCAGYALEIHPVFGPLDSPSDERTLATIEALPPPAGAVCPDPSVPGITAQLGITTPPVNRHDTGGWRALGWAPQGALVARGDVLVLVALDVSGSPVGAPAVLAADEPAPAPLAPGHATADASAWAFVNDVGIALHRRGSAAQLVMPSGFVRAEGTPIDVAVSPSARRLAWIEGGHLRWVDLDAPPPPAAAPPPTSAP